MIGVAILGTGVIAETHAAAYKNFVDLCEIRGVCDIAADKARAFVASQRIPRAAVYRDAAELFARSDIDLVSVCLPPQAHAVTAVQALDAGKHVLCEKPMAASLEECDTMIAAAERNKRILSPVANNRFTTDNRRVKTLLEAKVAGEVRHAVFNSLWWRGANYYDVWWRGKWDTEGGGCLTSHGVHHLDLLLWMLGKPTRVTAVINNVAHEASECEDIAIAILEYPGALVEATSSIVAHDEEQGIVIQGEKGRLSVPWRTAACKALPTGFPEKDEKTVHALQKAYDALPPVEHEGHLGQIRNVLESISAKKTPAVTAGEGRDAIELIAAIYKSAVTREPVELPLQKDDPFYTRESLVARMPRFHQKKSGENLVH